MPGGGKEKTAAPRKAPPNLHILTLTWWFFAAGMSMFAAALLSAWPSIPDLIRLQSMRNAQGWAPAHLLLLGFATMIAMGASYQLTQVIMRTSLYSKRLGYVHYAAYAAGVACLALGFGASDRLLVPGGIGVSIGVLLYGVNLAATFIGKREWNVYVLGVGLSWLSLAGTVALGTGMGLVFAGGWRGADEETMFRSHLWLGVGGWLSGLLLVYSLKLQPMFYVSRRKLPRAAFAAIGSFHAAVWGQVAALWTDAAWLAAVSDLLLLGALGWSFRHFREVRSQRGGRTPIGAVKIAYGLLQAQGGLYALWRLTVWLDWRGGMGTQLLILAVVLGWFTPTILAYLSKILPFLWWAYRYRTKEQKRQAVPLADMLPEPLLIRLLYGYLTGILLLLAGFAAAEPIAAQAGLALALACAASYMAILLRMFRRVK